ncbi:MAG: capsular biosynthesis protein, partial [Spirochaetales bacterium]|nr:capsular biosynthesis protein [Spirochaetales bacterium]
GKIYSEQFEPILAFGEHAEYRTLEAWAQEHATTHSTAFTEARTSVFADPAAKVEEKPVVKPVQAAVKFDVLEAIERDPDAVGKKKSE